MENYQHLIGKYGITQTCMTLTGLISIGTKSFEAISNHYLPTDRPVRVIGFSFNLLRVESVDTQQLNLFVN